MNEYFFVAVEQHIQRGRQLLAEVERVTEPEFDLLAQTCKQEINKAIRELKRLQIDPKMQIPEHKYQVIRLRRFRRAIDIISNTETIAVAAIARQGEKNDKFLNRLIRRIKGEIGYPLLPPVVTSLSTGYFYIIQNFNLMFVPLNEANFLLHLPDLYHELAHPLLYEEHDPDLKPFQTYEEYNPQVEPFQAVVSCAFDLASDYIDDQLNKELVRQGHGPQSFIVYLHVWQQSWWEWIIEFFCDLFATFTLGPAYAWSHVHLCMKTSSEPFYVPTRNISSHPADAARMMVMLEALSKIGFDEERRKIQEKWDKYIQILGTVPESEYERCYPEVLLNSFVNLAYDGINKMGCRIASPNLTDPTHKALNDAWQTFWDKPTEYIHWEQSKIEELHQLLGKRE